MPAAKREAVAYLCRNYQVNQRRACAATNSDFNGMRRLAEACRERFVLGPVLYDHNRTVPFGEHMFAVPISTFWS